MFSEVQYNFVGISMIQDAGKIALSQCMPTSTLFSYSGKYSHWILLKMKAWIIISKGIIGIMIVINNMTDWLITSHPNLRKFSRENGDVIDDRLRRSE